jgi:hypothetical protein
MSSHKTNINESNSSLKCSTTVSDFLVPDKNTEFGPTILAFMTKPDNICQCDSSHFPKKTDIKHAAVNFSYDNMGYG